MTYGTFVTWEGTSMFSTVLYLRVPIVLCLSHSLFSVYTVDPPIFGQSDSTKSEHASTEALVKISQDMIRVLDRLTTLRAPIDSIRKHRVEKFHGTSLEESDKTDFCLEKLQRALDEVKCPP